MALDGNLAARSATLNAAFREWLVQFAARDVDVLMERLGHVRAGRRFSREEMNEARISNPA